MDGNDRYRSYTGDGGYSDQRRQYARQYSDSASRGQTSNPYTARSSAGSSGYGADQGRYYEPQESTAWYGDGANPPAYSDPVYRPDRASFQNGTATRPSRVQYDPNRKRGNRNGNNGGKSTGKNKILGFVVIFALLAIIVVLGVFIFTQMTTIKVQVNGQEVEFRSGTKAASVVENGYASPIPGNLLAVDGTVLTPGGGTAYTLTVDGAPATGDTVLQRGNLVSVGNGEDVTESFTTTQETIPAQVYNDPTDFGSYWTGSIHSLDRPQDGVMSVKTGDVSGITIREVTTPAVDGGYHTYTANPSQPVIALTFDDGPWPETTAAILDILQQYGAKATFFTIGSQLPGYDETVGRMQSMGCQILTHTYDHAAGSGQGVNITYMSPDEQIWEVTQGYAAIAAITGQEPAHILRAPGGNFYGEAIWTLWDYVDAEIGWDVDTEDWSRPGSDAILNAILTVEPGQVILMHDGGGDRWQTVEALREAMPILVDRGYQFVTISELIAMSK